MLPYHVFVITSRCGHLQKMAKAQLSLETPYGPSQTNQTNDALGFLSLLLCSGVKISDRFMVQNIPFYFCPLIRLAYESYCLLSSALFWL